MGKTKELWQEQQDIKQEARDILEELLDVYPPLKVLSEIRAIEAKLLNL